MSSRPNQSSMWTTTATAVVATCVCGVAIAIRQRRQRRSYEHPADAPPTTRTPLRGTYERMIGHTPLYKLERLSNQIGRSIFVKMENCNPGGTGKDRAALSMLQTAEQEGYLPPPFFQQQHDNMGDNDMYQHNNNDNGTSTTTSHNNTRKSSKSSSTIISPEEEDILRQAILISKTGGIVLEGTSGSTGISLAQLCRSRGHACVVVMPDDQAMEKQHILKTLGALVHVVPNAAISNPQHYVNVAKRLASLATNGNYNNNCQALFVNQFENMANYHIHYTTTGPEIWNDLVKINNNNNNNNNNSTTTTFKNQNNNTSSSSSSIMDAFCMSSGTGGTIAGVSQYLKEQHPEVQIVLVDPPGSALYHKVTHGVAYAPQQRERGMKRHRYDTLAEGIGLDRVTANFAHARIDSALRVTDQEAVDMAHYLLELEGLWMGSSSAMNAVGAVQTALAMPPGSKVVTVMCDGGQRHLTRFWNRDFIVHEWGLQWPGDDNNDNGGGDTNDQDGTTTTHRRNRRIPACLQGIQ